MIIPLFRWRVKASPTRTRALERRRRGASNGPLVVEGARPISSRDARQPDLEGLGAGAVEGQHTWCVFRGIMIAQIAAS
jgi:hypothetical protein